MPNTQTLDNDLNYSKDSIDTPSSPNIHSPNLAPHQSNACAIQNLRSAENPNKIKKEKEANALFSPCRCHSPNAKNLPMQMPMLNARCARAKMSMTIGENEM